MCRKFDTGTARQFTRLSFWHHKVDVNVVVAKPTSQPSQLNSHPSIHSVPHSNFGLFPLSNRWDRYIHGIHLPTRVCRQVCVALWYSTTHRETERINSAPHNTLIVVQWQIWTLSLFLTLPCSLHLLQTWFYSSFCFVLVCMGLSLNILLVTILSLHGYCYQHSIAS